MSARSGGRGREGEVGEVGEAELRAALLRVLVLDVSPSDYLPIDDPEWVMLNAAIDELVRLRAIKAAAREVVREWGTGDWYRPDFEERIAALGAALGS